MSPVVERLGWMLIHSAWEDLLIWGVLQVVLAVLAQKTAHARYLTACLALLAMAAVPWMTFDVADFGARMNATVPVRTSTPVVPFQVTAPQPEVSPLPLAETASVPALLTTTPSHPALVLLVAAWLTGLLFFTARLAWQWSRLRGLICAPWRPLSAPWPERLAVLAERARIRRVVKLGETAALRVPVVARWLKPVILLPLGIAAALPAEQVEMILLHELAHIARHDFAVNLLQRVIETVFFYHPAVWSVSRRIRRERELACDDLAVAWSENPRAYAEALAACEDFRHEEPMLAATGGDLLARVERVLGIATRERRGPALAAAAGIAGVGLYLASMLLAPVLAAHVMSPSERVAKIQAMQPPLPQDGHAAAFAENVRVEGTVRTEDGEKVPANSTNGDQQGGIISVRSEGWSEDLGFTYSGPGRFGTAVRPGRIGLAMWPKGYAPLRLQNLQPRNGKITLDLLLRRGIPGHVQITDPAGKPIIGVTLKAVSQDADNQISIPATEVTTDAAGEATFGQVEADSEIHLTPGKPGWSMQQFVVTSWSAPAIVQLHPAVPMTGVAQDSVTHQPVAHATIIVAAIETTDRFSNQTFDPRSGQVLGHTDEQGRFELNTLNHDDSYRIYFVAPGYQTLPYPVLDGEKDKVFALTPGLHVRGHIIDPQMSLKQEYRPELRCDYSVWADPSMQYGQEHILPLTKLAAEIPFEFDDLPPGRTGFLIAKKWHSIDLQKNVDELVINLADGSGEPAENPPAPATRKLIVRFRQPAGSPPPTGHLDLQYDCVLHGQTVQLSATPEVMDGLVTVDIPPSSNVTMRGSRLNGYWFPVESFPFPAGSEPMTREVTIQPAGVIHGDVTAEGDLGTRPYSILPVQTDTPPAGNSSLDLSTNGGANHPLGGHYVTSSLPLGHTYVAVLDAIPTIFVSESARIDAEHPIADRKMHLVANDSLTGRFVDNERKPIAFADITMTYYPNATHGFSGLVGITRRDGTFTISHMNFAVPGYYEIGLQPGPRNDLHIDGHTPQPVEIGMPAKIPSVPAVPMATSQMDITGNVADENDQPVQGAHVLIHSGEGRSGLPDNYANTEDGRLDFIREKKESALVGVSDERGRFVMADVAHDIIYNLVVTAPGYGPFFADDVDPKAGPVQIKLQKLKPGQSGGEARGRVVDPEGRPVPGAQVMHYSYSHGDGTLYDGGVGPTIVPEATTDAQGGFSLPFKPGYEGVGVEIFAPGFARKMFPHLPFNNAIQDLQLDHGTTVSGRLMKDDMPLANRQIGLAQTQTYSDNYLGELTTATDSEGRFVFKDVVANADLEIYAKRDSLRMLGVPERKVIHSGTPGSSLAVGDIGLKPGMVISGRIVLSDGTTPKLGQPVQLHVFRSSTSDYQYIDLPADNTFQLMAADGETLALTAWIPGYHLPGNDQQTVHVAPGLKPIELRFVPGDIPTRKPDSASVKAEDLKAFFANPQFAQTHWLRADAEIKAGHLETVEEFLKAGMNPDGEKEFGTSSPPLYTATCTQQPAMVDLLLKCGADPRHLTSQGDLAIWAACWRGNKEIADTLLKAGGNPKPVRYLAGMGDIAGLAALDKQQPLTPDQIHDGLLFASASGHADVVDWLWAKESGLDAKAKDALLEQLFEGTIQMDHLDVFEHLESLHSASTQARDEAFELAIDWANPKFVKYLLDKGASPNAPLRYGYPPLLRTIGMSSGSRDPVETVRVLLDNGADINGSGADGQTPIMFAIDTDEYKVAQLLLQRGADLKHIDKEGKNAAMHAASRTTDDRQAFGFLEELMDKGAPLTGVDKRGDSLLQKLVAGSPPRHGGYDLSGEPPDDAEIQDFSETETRVLERVIQAGADVNAATGSDPPLHTAIQFGRFNAARILLNHGASLTALGGQFKRTPLASFFSVTFFGRPYTPEALQFLELLIDHGADPNEQTPAWGEKKQRESIADLVCVEACWRGHDFSSCRDALSILLAHGGKFGGAKSAADEAMLQAAALGDVQKLQEALAAGASVNAVEQIGMTPLILATRFGNDAATRWLLDHGANVAAKSTLNDGFTPLLMAVASGHVDIVALLLAKGAKLTPGGRELDVSINNGDRPMFDFLLKAGAKPGRQSLVNCIVEQQDDMARTLLDHGADPQPPSDYNNQGTVWWAATERRGDVLKMLLAHGADPTWKTNSGQTALDAAGGDQQIVSLLHDAMNKKK